MCCLSTRFLTCCFRSCKLRTIGTHGMLEISLTIWHLPNCESRTGRAAICSVPDPVAHTHTQLFQGNIIDFLIKINIHLFMPSCNVRQEKHIGCFSLFLNGSISIPRSTRSSDACESIFQLQVYNCYGITIYIFCFLLPSRQFPRAPEIRGEYFPC